MKGSELGMKAEGRWMEASEYVALLGAQQGVSGENSDQDG